MHEKRQTLERITTRAHQNDEMSERASSSNQPLVDDERFPGSFFRVPGVPMPGKTTWSLSK